MISQKLLRNLFIFGTLLALTSLSACEGCTTQIDPRTRLTEAAPGQYVYWPELPICVQKGARGWREWNIAARETLLTDECDIPSITFEYNNTMIAHGLAIKTYEYSKGTLYTCHIKIAPKTDNNIWVHEIGHCLGLEHDDFTGSIMYKHPKVLGARIMDYDIKAVLGEY